MKQLEKSDLKVGEIYIAQYKDRGYQGKYIVKINNNMCNCFNIYTNVGMLYRNGDFSNVTLDYCEATPEEKHWLETCIKADKFVSYEEAMKTFIPEYVECVYWKSYLDNPSHIEGVVYKILNGGFVELNPKYSLCVPTRYLEHKESFKPSTKEAYDAQFVVKEPEFVLPEIWWVRITKENLEDVCKFLGFELYDRAVGYVAGMLKHYRTGKIEKGWNNKSTTSYGSTFGNEITTEQFRKYVLKEEPVVLEEPKDRVFQVNQLRGKGTTIVQVQCSEGGVYKIGDKITVFDKTSPNKGKPFTIQGFRWNNAKTKLCAVTELHTPNGIGLDKIELYIEPKVEPKQELSLLEQAKLKYPVGTKFKNAYSGRIDYNSVFTIQNQNFINVLGGLTDGNNQWLYYQGKWAEIIEDFVLPKYWWIEASNISEFEIIIKFFNTKFRGTILNNGDYFEGCSFGFVPCFDNGDYYHNLTPDSKQKYLKLTLEQFKKYVLNEKV